MRKLKKSWLRSYLEYTDKQESPSVFHLWVGASVVAAALNRSVFLDQGFYKLYPNLFVALIAGSAKCRKGVALNMGLQFLKDLDDPKPHIIAQKITPEALLNSMAKNPIVVTDAKGAIVDTVNAGLVISPEFAVFLGREASNSGLLTLVTDMYDSWQDTYVAETIGRGRDVLHNLWFGMLGASTPDWLTMAIPQEAIGGGFTSRVVFVKVDKTEKAPNAFPYLSKEELLLQEDLLHDLNQVAKLAGQYVFTPEARAWYVEWYASYFETEAPSPELSGYYGRRHDIMLKLGMVMEASSGDGMIISLDSLQAANRMLQNVEGTLEAMMEVISYTKEGTMTHWVLKKIKRRKEMRFDELQRSCSSKIRTRELEDILVTLSNAGLVDVLTNVEKKGKGSVKYLGE